MFPNFMNDILRMARCGHCETPQTVADIQVVGVRRPEEFEAFYAEPVFIIIMDCKRCGQWTNHTMRLPSGNAIDGFIRFIELIKKECQGKKPPLNIPGLGKKGKPSPAKPASRAAELSDDSRLRPSIRHDQPHTPPTQREIQHFLKRLRMTSFKRGSRGFTKWMRDIGADGDAHGNGHTSG